MSNHNATLRLFHSQDPSEDERSPSPGRHEENASAGLAHPVRAHDAHAHAPRISGHYAVASSTEATQTPRSLAEIQAMAHALATALTERSEGVDVTQWRLRVAAAQARALEDILAGIDP